MKHQCPRILFVCLLLAASVAIRPPAAVAQCDFSIPPSGACTPGYDWPPRDEFSPTNGSCPAILSSPVGLITKKSVWTVRWPDGAVTTFSVVAGGQCLFTQTGCCLPSKFEFCYPIHHCPQVGEGFIQQLIVAAGVNHHLDDCGRLFCRAYEVFDGCNQGASNVRVQTRACVPIIGITPCVPRSCGGETRGCYFDWALCECECSPLLIDVLGNGFALTNADGGVEFDLNGDSKPDRMAWTQANGDDAFLVLDRNRNGIIDDGTELFGSFTPQSPSDTPNGFEALAEFDKPANGGNQDGWISGRDEIFSSLRLWQDTNHNGISEAEELRPLADAGLSAICLDYEEMKRRDEHGNLFRYRAKIFDARGTQHGRWAWDVFLITRFAK